jgi:Protein of unknown function (DUF4239)
MGDYGVLGAWLLLVVVVVGAVLIAIGGVRLSNRVMSHDTGPEHNSILSPFLTVVGLVYGALLGFTVVVGWQQYLSAEVNVSNEASTLVTLYRQTVAMPQSEQAQVRGQLRKYAEALQGPNGASRNSVRSAISGEPRSRSCIASSAHRNPAPRRARSTSSSSPK